MFKKPIKTLIMDGNVYLYRLINTVEYKALEGEPWPFKLEPTYELFRGIIEAHAKDVVNVTLKPFCRDRPFSGFGPERTFLEDYIFTRLGYVCEYHAAELKRFYMDCAGVSLHNQITEMIWEDGYDIWKPSFRETNELILEYLGDYRIMQWEQEHMNDGVYNERPRIS